MCCSVTDSEWTAVLAYRGGNSGCCVHEVSSVSLPCTQVCISLQTLDWNNSLGLRPPQLSLDQNDPQTWPSNVIREYKPLFWRLLYEISVVKSHVYQNDIKGTMGRYRATQTGKTARKLPKITTNTQNSYTEMEIYPNETQCNAKWPLKYKKQLPWEAKIRDTKRLQMTNNQHKDV